jgi:hypothetical protein
VFLGDPVQSTHRQSGLLSEISGESGQFGVSGKIKKLGLDSFVRGVATVLMHRAIVDEKTLPRHPVRRSQHHDIGLQILDSPPYLFDGSQGLTAMVIGFVTRFEHWQRMGQKNSTEKSTRLRRSRFMHGFWFSAAEFAFTPIREVGQFLFGIESVFDIHGEDPDDWRAIVRGQCKIFRHQCYGVDAIVLLRNHPAVFLPADVPGKSDHLDIDDHGRA